MASIKSTWLSAFCSDRSRRAAVRRRRLATLVPLAVAAALGSAAAWGKVYLTRDEALRRVFGDARIERESVFLTVPQIEAARRLAGERVEIRRALLTRFVASRDGVEIGTAYLDTHRVRTLDQTVLVVVDLDGSVSTVQVLAFAEPEEYLPREGWLEQFRGRELDDELGIKRGIHGITGATLSAEATTAAVRRVLALHEALETTRSDSTEAGP